MTTTTEMTSTRIELIGMYSDFHKDAFGMRPRGVNFDQFTDQELESAIDGFCAIANENAELDAEYAKTQLVSFKASLKRYQTEFGASDEKTAVKWLLDAEDCQDMMDVEGILYKEGILFTDYAKTFKGIAKDIIIAYH
jgi:hypothetical protein